MTVLLLKECEICGKPVDRLFATPCLVFERVIAMAEACAECAVEREPLAKALREIMLRETVCSGGAN